MNALRDSGRCGNNFPHRRRTAQEESGIRIFSVPEFYRLSRYGLVALLLAFLMRLLSGFSGALGGDCAVQPGQARSLVRLQHHLPVLRRALPDSGP